MKESKILFVLCFCVSGLLFGQKNVDLFIFLKDGIPTYRYVPSGNNIYGRDCTVSYVLKFK